MGMSFIVKLYIFRFVFMIDKYKRTVYIMIYGISSIVDKIHYSAIL